VSGVTAEQVEHDSGLARAVVMVDGRGQVAFGAGHDLLHLQTCRSLTELNRVDAVVAADQRAADE